MKIENNEIELISQNDNIINKYMIYEKSTNECTGYMKYRGYHHDVMIGDVGSIIYPKYRGHHYAEKALILLSQHLNEVGIDSFWVTCNKDNTPSLKLIQNHGQINFEKTINNDILFFECQTLEKIKTNKK